jgi:hypothetical protein
MCRLQERLTKEEDSKVRLQGKIFELLEKNVELEKSMEQMGRDIGLHTHTKEKAWSRWVAT